jgi:hypothetical protein
MTTPLRPVCPQCGSTEFRSNDRVMTSTWVREFSLDDQGELTLDYSDRHETFYDSCEPVDEATPWECAECLQPMSEAAIIAANQPETTHANTKG